MDKTSKISFLPNINIPDISITDCFLLCGEIVAACSVKQKNNETHLWVKCPFSIKILRTYKKHSAFGSKYNNLF